MVLMAPRDERGIGDVEFGHEARVGPATGAQFNEALDGSIVMHTLLSRRSVFSRTGSFYPLSAAPAADDSHVPFPTRGAHAHRVPPSSAGKGPSERLEAARTPDLRAPAANPVSAAHGQCYLPGQLPRRFGVINDRNTTWVMAACQLKRTSQIRARAKWLRGEWALAMGGLANQACRLGTRNAGKSVTGRGSDDGAPSPTGRGAQCPLAFRRGAGSR
jgi:hypothetical protein